MKTVIFACVHNAGLAPERAQGAQLLITMGCGDEAPWSPACAATTGRWTTRKASRRPG